jgi:hypothetical protein
MINRHDADGRSRGFRGFIDLNATEEPPYRHSQWVFAGAAGAAAQGYFHPTEKGGGCQQHLYEDRISDWTLFTRSSC